MVMEHPLFTITVLILFVRDCSAVIGSSGNTGAPTGPLRKLTPCPNNCYCSSDAVRCDFWPPSASSQYLRLPEETRILSLYKWPSELANSTFFHSIKDLRWLRLNGGYLLRFPSFSAMRHLSFVDVSDNRISFLPSNAFQNATFVSHLNVSGNLIKEVSSEFLSGLLHLRILDISRNPLIPQLPANFFKTSLNLRFLDISYTNTNVLDNKWIPHLQSLYFLNVSHNNISSLTTVKLAALEVFDASFNILEYLPILGNFPNLRELHVSHNHLLYLNAAETTQCNNLQILDISYCNLSNINEEVLSNCKQLKEINLSHNFNLWRIEHGSFSGLTHLAILHINHCPRLYDLEDEAFNGLVSLRELYLQESGVKVLPFSLSQLHNLTLVDLEGTSLLCNCYAHWLPQLLNTTKHSFWRGIDPIQCYDGINRSLAHLSDHLDYLDCTSVQVHSKPDQWTLAPWGQSALLECNITGNPPPQIVWLTVDHRLVVYKLLNDHPWLHHQIREALSLAEDPTNGKYQVLQSGHLLVREVSRNDIGRYKCFAFNAVSNTSLVTFLGIEDTIFRALVLESILFGFACAALFLFITLLMQFIRFSMERLGLQCCCCKDRLSPKAKQIRQLIESVENYKKAQLDKLKENYNSQVVSIKDSCYQQMERLRESYAHQTKNLKDLCDYSTQQISGARDQYIEQVNRVREYSTSQMNRVRENYVFQRNRIRKFSGHQLLRLRETYKYQQKTLNKLLETLPDLYIQNCRTGSCQRTDSIIFEDEIDGLDIYYKVDFLDNQSYSSDYYTPSSTLTRQSRGICKNTHSRDGSTTSGGTEYQEAHSWVLRQGSIRSDTIVPHQRFHCRSLSIATTPTGTLPPTESQHKGHKRSISASTHPSPHFFPPKSPLPEENGDSNSSVRLPNLHSPKSAGDSPLHTPIHDLIIPTVKEQRIKFQLSSSLSKSDSLVTPSSCDSMSGVTFSHLPCQHSDQITCDIEPQSAEESSRMSPDKSTSDATTHETAL